MKHKKIQKKRIKKFVYECMLGIFIDLSVVFVPRQFPDRP